jgi:hypothetical protein
MACLIPSTNISKTVESGTSAISGNKRVSRANVIPKSKSCHNTMMIIFLKLAHMQKVVSMQILTRLK